MNITVSLDDELVRKIRRIAAERDTTLTGLIRESLQQIAVEDAGRGRKQREKEALENSFAKFEFQAGTKKWTRDELHERT